MTHQRNRARAIPLVIALAVALLVGGLVFPSLNSGAENWETPSAAQWEALRFCESSGNYAAVNSADTDGLPRYGAYQFSQATWDETAASAGLTHLIGVLPTTATPAEQDIMAMHLYAWRGPSPWPDPGCGRYLPGGSAAVVVVLATVTPVPTAAPTPIPTPVAVAPAVTDPVFTG